MPDIGGLPDVDCEIASNLERLVLAEIADHVELDGATVDALVRGIVSLLQSPQGLSSADQDGSSEQVSCGEKISCRFVVPVATGSGSFPEQPDMLGHSG